MNEQNEHSERVEVVEVEGKNNALTLPMSILISGVLISGSIFYLVWSQGKSANPAAPVQPQAQNAQPAGDVTKLLTVGDRDVITGDPKAPVTLIEYGDYQCPFCGRFFQYTEPLIRENYIKTGKVRMIYRDLAFLGPESTLAAEASECAKDQGKSWAYHDALFTAEIADGQENSGNMTRDFFLKLASQVGLDTKAFAACYDSKKYETVVKNLTQVANAAGVNSTPTSFVNGKEIVGAQPYSVFQQAIDGFLK